MKFTKMHGLGNDFILINCIKQEIKEPSELAKEVCDRHFGIGADGILLVLPSECADFKMKLFNYDGSEGEMCGNGIRCFAKYIYEKNLSKKEKINIETLAGIKIAELSIQDNKVVSIRVDMGLPKLKKKEVPVTFGNPDDMMLNEEIKLPNGEKLKLTAVNTGVPHTVLFVDNIEAVNVLKLGSLIRHFKEVFPEGTNVNFVQILEKNNFKVRTYERGVENETLACGTGATAVSVAVTLLNRTDANKPIKLTFKGGEIKTEIKMEDGRIKNIFMIGPAKIVFEGEYSGEKK